MPEASTAEATETVAWAPEPSELVGSGLLTAPLDASPALIYVKDRDGRYVRINRRFAESLGTSAERVLGHTDAELPTGETIDGPRLDTGAPSDTEPRQLEYIVGAFGKRPALSVLRFTLFDDADERIGTCGVAAPAGHGAVARAECERLLGIAGHAPPLEVLPMGAPALEASRPAEPVPAVEPGQAEAQADVRLTAALQHERARAERAERALAAERERAQQAEVALAQERAREQAATESLVRERARAEQDAARLATAIEQERGRAERAEKDLADERERSQRAETTLALANERQQAAGAALAQERERAQQAEEARGAAQAKVAATRQHAEAELAAIRRETEAQLADERARVEELTGRLTVIQREGAGDVDAAALAAAEAERVRAEQEAVRLATALEHERVRAERAETALADERERSQRAETTLALAGERQQAADTALAQEQERAQRAEEAHGAAEAELAAARQAADNLERQREDLTAALGAAQERATAMAASAPPELPASSDGRETATPNRVQWGATAQRALAMAVARSSDWDSTLREATKAIGVEGGWHAAFAWVTDLRSKRLRCAASWIDPEAELGHFETATRQQMLTRRETRLGAAINSGELRWIDDDPTGPERRWAAVQRHGMQVALLVPLRAADGPPVAVLELLSRDARPAGSTLDAAYEAIALELGHVCQLGLLGAEPRWGFGRV